MTQSTNNDLKYITDLLVELKSDIKEIKSTTNNIDKRLIVVETRLDEQKAAVGKIPELAEKVGELKTGDK